MLMIIRYKLLILLLFHVCIMPTDGFYVELNETIVQNTIQKPISCSLGIIFHHIEQ